jgi:hypothetical protein
VINFKLLAIAAAVLGSVTIAMPTSSQAVPQAVPVKIDAASDHNLVQVYHRYYRYGRCYARLHRYYHEHYRPCDDYYRLYYGYYRPYRPYYGYYRTYRPYYGYYPYDDRPWIGPGMGLSFGY